MVKIAVIEPVRDFDDFDRPSLSFENQPFLSASGSGFGAGGSEAGFKMPVGLGGGVEPRQLVVLAPTLVLALRQVGAQAWEQVWRLAATEVVSISALVLQAV